MIVDGPDIPIGGNGPIVNLDIIFQPIIDWFSHMLTWQFSGAGVTMTIRDLFAVIIVMLLIVHFVFDVVKYNPFKGGKV